MKTAVCNSAKEDFLRGVHLTSDRYRLALYEDGLDETVTNYLSDNEASGDGYQAGGKILGGATVTLKNGEAHLTFSTPIIWENASISARGAMIYNASKENKALAVFDFGQDFISTNGPFTVKIPNEGAIILS